MKFMKLLRGILYFFDFLDIIFCDYFDNKGVIKCDIIILRYFLVVYFIVLL